MIRFAAAQHQILEVVTASVAAVFIDGHGLDTPCVVYMV
jgi:hypothetical protein